MLTFLALTVVAACAEGAGLLLLVPLLQAFGLNNDPQAIQQSSSVPWVLLLYVGLVVGGALILRARVMASTRLRLDFVDSLRQMLYRAMLNLNWTAFQGSRPSDLTQTIQVDLARAGFAIEMAANLCITLLTALTLLGVAASLSPLLAISAVLFGGILWVLSGSLTRRTLQQGARQVHAGQSLQADLTDTLSGLRLIKSFGAEQRRLDGFRHHLQEQQNTHITHQRDVATRMVINRGLAATVIAVSLGVAIQGFSLGIAEALVFLLAFARLLQSGLGAEYAWRNLLITLPAFTQAESRLHWCLSHQDTTAGDHPLPPLTHSLRLSGITVLYPGQDAPALTGIDLTLPAGSVTVLTGPSGAGKSTLADVIMGLTTPTSGTLLLDDVVVDDIHRTAWRHQIGYVPQDAFLFHDTLRANLRLARPDAEDDTLWAALEQAGFAETVRALPDGLDHIAGDRGNRLSGGERQRLCIARALLRSPSLLVLDEPTSALDDASETRILKTLDALRGQTTILMITHRDAPLHLADQIIRLDGGRRMT